jgi:hypothetical protein
MILVQRKSIRYSLSLERIHRLHHIIKDEHCCQIGSNINGACELESQKGKRFIHATQDNNLKGWTETKSITSVRNIHNLLPLFSYQLSAIPQVPATARVPTYKLWWFQVWILLQKKWCNWDCSSQKFAPFLEDAVFSTTGSKGCASYLCLVCDILYLGSLLVLWVKIGHDDLLLLDRWTNITSY